MPKVAANFRKLRAASSLLSREPRSSCCVKKAVSVTKELAHRTFQCCPLPLVWVCFRFSWPLPNFTQTAQIDSRESPRGFPRTVSVMALGVKQVW